MRATRNAYKNVAGKPDEKREVGRPRHIRKDMRTDLGEIGWKGVEWIHVTQDRDQYQALVNTVMNLRVL
jgi:hypothetical protein